MTQIGNPLLHLPQHAAGGGTVNVEARVLAAVRGRNDERLTFDGETDVAEKSFIEDRIPLRDRTRHDRLRGPHECARWAFAVQTLGKNSGQAPRMGERKV